jgi:hypothetical protein
VTCSSDTVVEIAMSGDGRPPPSPWDSGFSSGASMGRPGQAHEPAREQYT